jgi:hypothetical protein
MQQRAHDIPIPPTRQPVRRDSRHSDFAGNFATSCNYPQNTDFRTRVAIQVVQGMFYVNLSQQKGYKAISSPWQKLACRVLNHLLGATMPVADGPGTEDQNAVNFVAL